MKSNKKNNKSPEAIHPQKTAQEYYELAINLVRQNDIAGGKKAVLEAIKLKPDYAEAYAYLGIIYKHLREISEAIKAYEKVIAINPDYVEAYYNIGVILAEGGKLAEAADYFRKSIKVKPDYAEAYNNLGVVLKSQPSSSFAEMDEVFRKALALNPQYAEPHYNLGAILTEEGILEEAEKYCRQALQLNPNYLQAYYNMGFILTEKRLLQQGQEWYLKGIKLKPDYAKAHFSLGLNLLLSGNLKRGFAEYEWRWQAYDIFFPKLEQPRWKGENLKDKTILLISEQGLGDTLQFIRYGFRLKELGATVKVACQAPLVQLLKNQGIFAEVVPVHEKIQTTFDFYASLMSLPYLFGTTLAELPGKIPYIKASESPKLQPVEGTKIKIGIVWASGLRNNDPELYKIYQKKSCGVNRFLELLAVEGVTLYSLQVGPDAGEIDGLSNNPRVVNLTPKIKDFTDTAGIIKQLDLVISVDTAVVHLVGAMGKPVWVLLPFSADWRWLLGRSDSPWYPTMRLFRQVKRGDWDGVFAIVKEALQFGIVF